MEVNELNGCVQRLLLIWVDGEMKEHVLIAKIAEENQQECLL